MTTEAPTGKAELYDEIARLLFAATDHSAHPLDLLRGILEEATRRGEEAEATRAALEGVPDGGTPGEWRATGRFTVKSEGLSVCTTANKDDAVAEEDAALIVGAVNAVRRLKGEL